MSGKRSARPNARSASVPVDLLLASGERRQRTGDLASAEQTYRRALSENPYEPRATQLLAAILVDRNDIDGAIDLFEAATPHVGRPQLDNFAFYGNFAFTLRRAGRLRSAESVLRALVAAAPGAWQPWHNLGQTLKDLGRHDEAAVALRRAVMLEPEYGPNHAALGEVLHNLGRLNSADVSLRRAIELGCANDHGVWTVLAKNQRMLGHLDEALEMAERALGARAVAWPRTGTPAWCSWSSGASTSRWPTSRRRSPPIPATTSHTATSATHSSRPVASPSRSIRGTERSRRVRAAPNATYRFRGGHRPTPTRACSCIASRASATRSCSRRCIPTSSTRRARSSSSATRLVPLFTRSFPKAEVRAQTCDERFRATARDIEYATPAGSLIRWFRPTVEAFPDRPSYLVPDAARVARWRERLATLGPGPYVGISWRSKLQTAERRIEYTRLDEWGDVFSVPGATWVNLQYDDCNRELHDAETRFGVRIHRWDWLDLMNDFDEVAALTTARSISSSRRSTRCRCSAGRWVCAPWRWATATAGASWAPGRMPWMPSIVVASRMPNEEWDEVLTVAAREVAMLAAPAEVEARVGGGISCST